MLGQPYSVPLADAPIDQGDIFLDVAAFLWEENGGWAPRNIPGHLQLGVGSYVVVSQACYLDRLRSADGKHPVLLAPIFPFDDLVAGGILKRAALQDLKNATKYHWEYLEPCPTAFAYHAAVDLRQLQFLPIGLLRTYVSLGCRRAHLNPPYRERLGWQLATSFARVGLPPR